MKNSPSLTINKVEVPPLGLRPRIMWLEDRYHEIVQAMNRFIDGRKNIPQEWLNELNDINNQIKEERGETPKTYF